MDVATPQTRIHARPEQQLARVIARGLTFVDQVVWMGLEMIGLTKTNLGDL